MLGLGVFVFNVPIFVIGGILLERKIMKLNVLLCCFLLIGCYFGTTLEAQQDIDINFGETRLDVFIEFVAKETGKRFLYDSTVKGKKIYLISASPVSKEDLYKIFLSMMEYNGFILEETGRGSSQIIKIKRNIQGPWTPTILIDSEKELDIIKDQDRFITMVIKLKYISAREVQTTLRALRIVNPQGGNLAGIEGSNTILITDFAPNVKRIYEVIKQMDEQGAEKEFRVIKLKHAVSEEVVEKLKEFAIEKRRSSGIGLGPNLDEVKISADRRLNAVVIQAYKDKMQQMVDLINILDEGLDEDPTRIHYIRLHHADASKLQETLAKLLEGGNFTKKKGPASKASSSSEAEQISTAIQAEPQTNSLIVRAESHEWREIQKIIKQVDVRRPQVLIEGALIEVSPEDLLGLGIELFWSETNKDGVSVSGGSDFGLSNLVAVDKDGNATGIDSVGDLNNIEKFGKVPLVQDSRQNEFGRGGTGFINYKDIFTIPALLKANKKDAYFKILSIPSVLTNDNERAMIKVADAAAADTTTDNNSGSQTTAFGGYQEAGTVLTITPHISGEENYLRLEIDQNINEFDTTQVSNESGIPAQRRRQITTTITVPDGHTVAIGGFTFDKESETVEKIPLLGDLPIVGILFQTRVISHQKRNIYLFLTPHILREPNFKDLFKHSYDYKMNAHKLGANIGKIDKTFNDYLAKYRIDKGKLRPVYMLEYKTPTDQQQPPADNGTR